MNGLRNLRLLGILEGISFLVLLLVAMPLKYMFALPIATRIVGSIHGILLLMFMAALFRIALERSWPLRRSLTVLGAALVPCGPFFLDRILKDEIKNEVVSAPES